MDGKMKFAGRDAQDHFGMGMGLFDNLDILGDAEERFSSRPSGSSANRSWNNAQLSPATGLAGHQSTGVNASSRLSDVTASLRRQSASGRPADPEALKALQQLKRRVNDLQKAPHVGQGDRSSSLTQRTSSRKSQQQQAHKSRRNSQSGSRPASKLSMSASQVSLFGPTVSTRTGRCTRKCSPQTTFCRR